MTYRYQTLAEQQRENAFRHMRRGFRHLENGATDHAKGSFRKARREFRKSTNGVIAGMAFRVIYERAAEDIEHTILVGAGSVPGFGLLNNCTQVQIIRPMELTTNGV